MHVLVEARGKYLPLKMELTDLAKLAGEEALGILLFLPPGARITVHITTPIFLFGCWVSELRSSSLYNKHCPH